MPTKMLGTLAYIVKIDADQQAQHGMDHHSTSAWCDGLRFAITASGVSCGELPIYMLPKWDQVRMGSGPVVVHIVGSPKRAPTLVPGTFVACQQRFYCVNIQQRYEHAVATRAPNWLTTNCRCAQCAFCGNCHHLKNRGLHSTQRPRKYTAILLLRVCSEELL